MKSGPHSHSNSTSYWWPGIGRKEGVKENVHVDAGMRS